MLHAKDVLVRGLTATACQEAEEDHYKRLRSFDCPVRRVAFTAIQGSIARHPKATAKILSLNLQSAEGQYVGSGWESIVLSHGDGLSVAKFMHRSLLLSAPKRQELAKQIADGYQTMASFLDTFVLPQTVDIAEHPLYPGREAVRIIQPHEDFVDPNFFRLGSQAALVRCLGSIRAESPHTLDELSDFIDRSYELDAKHKLLPDLCGDANLVMKARGGIVMLDGSPLSDFGHARERALANIGALEQALVEY